MILDFLSISFSACLCCARSSFHQSSSSSSFLSLILRSSSFRRPTLNTKPHIRSTSFSAPHFSRKNMTEQDNFGDDSFLWEIDVDAVVQQNRAQRAQVSSTSSFPWKNKPTTGSAPENNHNSSNSNSNNNSNNNSFLSHKPPVIFQDNPNPKLSDRFQTSSSAELSPHRKNQPERKYINRPSHEIPQSPDLENPDGAISTLNTCKKPRLDLNLDSDLVRSLNHTLSEYFGYTQFRAGQLEVIHNVLQHRDVAVFWATGAGKSLCYQIPALHMGHVVVVISPLISLMQDQVHKLNGIQDKLLATFLGSGQRDLSMENRALQGEFPLVYVTPEKFMSAGFLDRLTQMHLNTKPLALIAVDESHCLSQWGHDFRPEYRQLNVIRNHTQLQNIPIMALTATAVPTVQTDIISSLHLRNPYVALQSFDRPNLALSVLKKRATGGGTMKATLEPLLESLNRKTSTVIYAATRDQVEELTALLSQKLDKDVKVQAYHAGMSNDQRTLAHTNFLIGKTHIICATVAFGMGIDKPDIRRVVHYGPPKSVEEYYQQIGRAGRDGLPAECIMFFSDGDFLRYRDPFYTERLSLDALNTYLDSLIALQNYALDFQTCRRKALLQFFQEIPVFGERCGTCDTCQAQTTYANDLERDLGTMGARIVLKAVASVREQGLSVIEKLIAGNIVEHYRYLAGVDSLQVQRDIQTARNQMTTKMPIAYFRELLAPLVHKGLLNTLCIKFNKGKFTSSYTAYQITQKGLDLLNDETAPIILPVPQSIRDLERDEEEKRRKKLAILESSGVNLKLIPKQELEAGDGEVIRAFIKWNSYMSSLSRLGKNARIQEIEDLRARIEDWRLDTASKYKLAPANVLAEHVACVIAYTVASLKPGVKVEMEALKAAGVRSKEVASLVSSLDTWVDTFQPAQTPDEFESVSPLAVSDMIFEENTYEPPCPWEHAKYKPNKSGLAAWESSHQRFLAGEHPQTIAMSQTSGRPIQVSTVVGHILQGLEQGRPVPLKRLAVVSPAPSKEEWEQLEHAELLSGLNVVGDPDSLGPNGEKFTKTEFLRPIMGDEFTDAVFTERNETEKEKFSAWIGKLNWYVGLKRAQFKPQFSPKVDVNLK